MKVVKVHSAGSIGGYSYYKASIFETNENGVYKNTGSCTTKVTTLKKAEMLGRNLAATNEIPFISGYGSLHNVKVEEVTI